LYKRLKIQLTGAVQGVGFRPFVFNIANRYNLKGYVLNDTEGVLIEIEGEKDNIDKFLVSLFSEKPPLAHIFSSYIEELDFFGYKDFQIKSSKSNKEKQVFILPDISICDECLKEIKDKNNRRYRYPFTNCTNCGPRFSIIQKLPYDRENTTMKNFKMCEICKEEYHNPLDRRFHAQPNACPVCGPEISLYTSKKEFIAKGDEALRVVINLLKEGKIIAIKGIGGFHLVADATNDYPLKELRKRKNRGEKPFAVMFKNINEIEKYTIINDFEKAVILSPERPIVIVKLRENKKISQYVAPNLRKLGVFLPYSPLHYLLLNDYENPLVMTSANLSDEPIVKDNEEAFNKLSVFTDYILIHNRDIENRVDDSVVRVINNNISFIRRSRGYAPLPIKLPFNLNKKVLAVGGHQKNTIAIAFENKAILSQHIGDLETLDACKSFEDTICKFLDLYDFKPEVILSDLHPRYYSTKFAEDFSKKYSIKHIKVQHHFAHALSVMVDNEIKEEEKILAVCWDGTGYGLDGNLWGGEFLISSYQSFNRILYFDYFKLIGGEKAVKEPRRVAISILFEIFGKDIPFFKAFSEKEIENLYLIWQKNINCYLTSSVGRLFDAVSSLLDIKQILSYEGQSGMIMEDLYDNSIKDFYPYSINENKIIWKEIIFSLLDDKSNTEVKISRFINTLAKIVIDIGKNFDIPVGLSGGVFQNKPLVEKIIDLAHKNNIKILIHKKVPPNDGGLSLGQVAHLLI